jgi:hypothetical protein
VKVELVSPPMSMPFLTHWYAKVRGARERKAPSRSGAQVPWLQVSSWLIPDPPVTMGAPAPFGSCSSAGKFEKLSPLNTVEALPEPLRFPVRIEPPPKVAQ